MFFLRFNPEETDVGVIPKAAAPTIAVPWLVPAQHPVTQGASRRAGLSELHSSLGNPHV